MDRGVAVRLKFGHLDTGAFYRAATIVVLVNRVGLADEAAVAKVVADATFDFVDGVMTLEDVDVSEAIRSDAVTAAVSRVAALAEVRSVLVGHQRDWVVRHDCHAVVEGRDIGTVVFPNSRLKIYLTARPEVRAARRATQDGDTDAKTVEQELGRRDRVDSTRAVSPLTMADDAVEIDSSDLNLPEVIDTVLSLAAERGITPEPT